MSLREEDLNGRRQSVRIDVEYPRSSVRTGRVDLVVRVPETWSSDIIVHSSLGKARASRFVRGEARPWPGTCEVKFINETCDIVLMPEPE